MVIKELVLQLQEKTFDAPVPTVTGEDPSRLSVVFDEVVIKERLKVEGGTSRTILSQFDGPVAFSQDVRFDAVTSFSKLLILQMILSQHQQLQVL